MSPTPSRPTTPARRQQSVRTDETLLDAAVAVADTEGWGGLTPGHLAEVTGLSRPTVLKRHPDRAALGAAVWRARLAEPLRSALGALVATCDRAPVSSADLLASLEPFLHPDQSMRAAAELLLVASYVPEVALAIDETLGVDLTAWCTPHRGRATRTSAARRTFVVAIALGFTIEARRHAGLELDMVEEVDRLAAALARPSAPTRLPAARAEHLDALIRAGELR